MIDEKVDKVFTLSLELACAVNELRREVAALGDQEPEPTVGCPACGGEMVEADAVRMICLGCNALSMR